jgi:hypothetical protein
VVLVERAPSQRLQVRPSVQMHHQNDEAGELMSEKPANMDLSCCQSLMHAIQQPNFLGTHDYGENPGYQTPVIV